VILTLGTQDGFEVSFGVSTETCRALGWTLAHEADRTAEPEVPDDELKAATATVLN
jgi:hypothetical protein